MLLANGGGAGPRRFSFDGLAVDAMAAREYNITLRMDKS